MKKVTNITLGGIVFAIEEDAYDVLEAYLKSIEVKFTASEDYGEIAADIENAIAEKFHTQGKSEKNAVLLADIETVTKAMGTADEVSDESGEASKDSSENTEETASVKDSESKKRLYRDTEDSIIAGVASGLAHYFGIDPVIVRLLFVVSIFFNGLGILGYIILWFVVPPARTTSEKFAMQGMKVTLDKITDRVKKNLHDLEESDYVAAKGAWSKVRRVLVKFFNVLAIVAHAVFRFLRMLVGLAFVIGGALGTAGLISMYGVVLLSEKVFFSNEVQIALDTMLSSTLGVVAITSSFVMMVIPLQALIITGASLLAKRNFFTIAKGVTLAVIWIIAAVLAGTTSALQVEQVVQKIDSIEWEEGNHGIHVTIEEDRIEIETLHSSDIVASTTDNTASSTVNN